jgi:hypothetical protein
MATANQAAASDLLFPVQEVSPEVRAHIRSIEDAGRVLMERIDAFKRAFPESAGVKPNPVKARIMLFDQKHRERTQLPAPIVWGRDMKTMKEIVERYGEEETDAMIREFFATADDYVQRTGFTVLTFSKAIAGIISRRVRVVKGHGITRNTEANAEQSALAVQMIQRRG